MKPTILHIGGKGPTRTQAHYTDFCSAGPQLLRHRGQWPDLDYLARIVRTYNHIDRWRWEHGEFSGRRRCVVLERGKEKRHVMTVDAPCGLTMYEFAYTVAERLLAVPGVREAVRHERSL